MNDNRRWKLDELAMKVSHCIEQIYHHSQDNSSIDFIRLYFEALTKVINFDSAVWVAYSKGITKQLDQIQTYNLPNNISGQLKEVFNSDGEHPFFKGTLTTPGQPNCYSPDVNEQCALHRSKDYIQHCKSLGLEHSLSVFILDEQGENGYLTNLYRADAFYSQQDFDVLTFILPHLLGSEDIRDLSMQNHILKHNKSNKAIYDRTDYTREVKSGLLDLLTKTEHNVAKLMAKGIQTKAIAHELHSSPRTVEKHQACIYKKLDTGNRNNTVAYLVKHLV